MSRTELEVNEVLLTRWMRSLPNPTEKLAADARISTKTAKAILFEGYVPSGKIRWSVSLALGIPESELWRPKAA